MPNVTLINPFEITPEQEFEFVQKWKVAVDYLQSQRGFVSSELHRSRDQASRFRFTNISVWETPEHFQRAIQQTEFVKIMEDLSFPHFSALYDPFLQWHRARPRRRLAAPTRKITARAARLVNIPAISPSGGLGHLS
jgi:heme-degrading monooxygenase HmoA